MDLEPVSKDLGLVTAYAYAKEGGYAGTEEEFKQSMAIASKAVKRIGKEDYSSGWNDEGLKVKVGEVGHNTTLSFDFVNHSRKENVWDNFVLIFASSTYFRPDNYSWGSQTVATKGNNWDASTQKSDMDGASVHVDVINWYGTVRVQFIILTAAGVLRYQYYDLAGTFGGSAYSIALTVDRAYADLYLDSVRVCQTGLMIHKPFATDGAFRGNFHMVDNLNRTAVGAGYSYVQNYNSDGTIQYMSRFSPSSIAVISKFFNGGAADSVGIRRTENPNENYVRGELYLNQGYYDRSTVFISETLTPEKLQQSNRLVTRVGLTDCTNTFEQPPKVKSETVTVPAGYEMRMSLRNYHAETGASNWHNVVAVVSDDADIQAYLRLDSFGWGTGYDETFNESDWDWDTFLSDTQGALLDVIAKNFGNYTTIEFIVTSSAGKRHRQYYRVATTACNLYFTVDHSYIDIMNDSITWRRITPRIGRIVISDTWDGEGPYTQSIPSIVSGIEVTTNSQIDLQPTASQLTQLIEDGVTGLFVVNNNGSLTVNATGAAPSTPMTIQCLVTEVEV